MRGIVFQAAFVGWSLGLGLLVLPLSPFLDGNHVRRWARVWEAGIAFLLRTLCGIRIEVRGEPPTTPSLIAAKHQSALETVAFHRLVPEIAVLLKAELLRVPLLGRYLVQAGCVPIDRDGGTKAMRQTIRAASERLDDGLSLLVFPEGTRVPPGERRPYRPGIAALYLQLQRPVVPVALHTGHVWGKGLFAKRPGTAVISFLEPIPPGLDRRTFMARLEHAIESESLKLAGLQPPSPLPGTSP